MRACADGTVRTATDGVLRMNGLLKGLAKDYAIYGLGEFINRFSQVLILPLVFVYLSVDEFGLLDYFLTLKNIASVVMGMGLLTALMRLGAGDGAEDSRVVNSNALFTVVTANVISVLLILPFGDQVTQLLLSQNLGTELVLTVIISALFAIRTVPIGILRMRQMPARYMAVSMTYFLVYVSSSYVMLRWYQQGYLAFLYGNIVGLTASLALGFALTHGQYASTLSRSLSARLVKFGAAILSTSICLTFIVSSNRFFLVADASFEDIGILGMATRFSLLVGGLLIAPFNLAWLPFVNSIFRKPDFVTVIQHVFEWYTFAALTLTLAISFLSADAFVLIGKPEYLASAWYIPFFALSYVFLGYFFIFGAGIYLERRSRDYWKISIAVMIANIVMYIVYPGPMDVLTVSAITLVSHMLLALGAVYYGRGVVSVRVFSKKVIVLSVCVAVVVGVLLIISLAVLNPYLAMSLKVASLLAFAIVVTFTGFVTSEERVLIRDMIRNRTGH